MYICTNAALRRHSTHTLNILTVRTPVYTPGQLKYHTCTDTYRISIVRGRGRPSTSSLDC
ncbi:hypothetical protein CSUI_006427 [Cystoisospora suis]|uniref:Uncharacterized protein n=1 Tax=Cystoisospora suis TaxID=483139 RepID=A0A2C6KUI8_9APIC|nr:hypothetical protein CSUI_006427 [Cystoisospora suis]